MFALSLAEEQNESAAVEVAEEVLSPEEQMNRDAQLAKKLQVTICILDAQIAVKLLLF